MVNCGNMGNNLKDLKLDIGKIEKMQIVDQIQNVDKIREKSYI